MAQDEPPAVPAPALSEGNPEDAGRQGPPEQGMKGPPRAATTEDAAPRLPGDLPPLPSRFYRGRPKHVRCGYCERRFDTAQELNDHMRTVHKGALAGSEKDHSH